MTIQNTLLFVFRLKKNPYNPDAAKLLVDGGNEYMRDVVRVLNCILALNGSFRYSGPGTTFVNKSIVSG